MTDQQTDAYVAALETELAGYERFGRDERAEQVRAEIDRVTGRTREPAAKQTRPRGAGAQKRA